MSPADRQAGAGFRAKRAPACVATLLAALLAGCSPPPTPLPPPEPAVVRVLATDLTEPLLWDLAEAYAAVNPAVVVVPGMAPPASLPAALEAGEAELGLMLADGAAEDAGLFASPVAYVPVRVVAHPSNPVAGLTAAQVQALFTGAVGEWESVGGRAAPVQVVARAGSSDGAQLFNAQMLNGAEPAAGGRVAPTWAAMRELVAENPNAIGYLPAAEVDDSVSVVDVPVEVTGLVAAVAVAEPTGPARDFIAWVQSDEGQDVVAERYVPLR